MHLPVSLLIPVFVAIMLAGPFSSEIALAKRIPMNYPSLSVGLTAGADSGASHLVIEDEHSLATLKADVGKAYGIIEAILLPEIRKEFDEKKDIYSNNYVDIIGDY